ncbi:MAG: polC, partial [Proteobacteria bacterium]|nr:polC [Pseudomonadota bacterium]
PQHHRHGLDAIIARHGLACTARHRALGDARVLWEFMQLIEREHAPQTIEQAVTKAMKRPKLPPDLVPDTLDHVPEAPGVYVFYGENEVPLYVGRSLNLRSRVQAHFTGDQSAGRALRIAREIRRVDWIETGGELGALLLEAQLVKEKAPIHNRHLRGQGESCSWRTCDDPGQGPPLDLVWVRDLDPRELGRLHGLFRSRREATNTLREIASAYQLCPKRLGLEAGRGACFALPLKKCRGVCVGRESAAAHDLRLRAALSSLRLKAWPFAGRIAIREEDGGRGREYFHVFDAWCHVGTESTQSGLYEAAARRGDPVFDADTYRILIRYLAREPKGIIDLARAAV